MTPFDKLAAYITLRIAAIQGCPKENMSQRMLDDAAEQVKGAINFHENFKLITSFEYSGLMGAVDREFAKCAEELGYDY